MLALLLTACSQNNKSPKIITASEFDAVYKMGDFSFDCTVKWQNSTAFVTVKSTNAAGMTISCDGRKVTFSKGKMLKRVPKDNVDSSNPARLLWEIFSAIENGGTKTSLGDFEVVCDKKGNIQSITVADISLTRISHLKN